MGIRQFRYSSDNLGYLVYGNATALAIDGGAGRAILDFVETNGLQLKYVTNTHKHPDHTAGTGDLVKLSGAEYLSREMLLKAGQVVIDDLTVEVIDTPGHTDDSLSFSVATSLITGDTLFNGTVGNCFSGDLKAFYESVKKLLAYPAATRVYAGHDYVSYAMAFAKIVEPDNAEIDAYLKKYDNAHIYSTLADELEVNPYLRFNADPIIALLIKRGFPVGTEYDRWLGVMSLE
jgi:hydroxyacylglutathione hydrolase